ncbi:MAG: hypothetical protein P8L17_00640 [Methylophilaceae bacterium]|nr:hypothetical protein [Methylophilaceae bacterium]
MLEIQIISACLGVAVGFVFALTGAGGAMIAIPLLVFFQYQHLSSYAHRAACRIKCSSCWGFARLIQQKGAL